MSTLRRSAVLGGALALLSALSLAAPALADAPSITFTSPGGDDPVRVSDPTIAARVAMQNGGTVVRQVELSVQQLDTNRAPLTAAVDGNRQSRQDVAFRVALPFNGRYRATLKAWGADPPLFGTLEDGEVESTSRSREFLVAAPPAPPRDVKAVVDEATRTVTLTWKANDEGDLIGYIVQRAAGDGPFADVGTVTKTDRPTYRDSGTAEAGGVYRYQVVAVRSDGVTKDKGISSDPSAVTPEATANVPGPPAPPSGTPGTTVVASTPGSSTPGTTTAAASKNPGALTTSGSVDLSGFKTLQSQAQARAATPRTTRPADTGFKSTLPFATTQPQEEGEVAEEGGELGEVAADSPQFRELGTEDDGSRRQESLAFLAAGLLATVLLMHVLWIKSEVKRTPLEPLAPE